MPATLEQFFTEQREKFSKQREDARALLDEAESELRALDAYEAAKKAKPAGQADSEKKPRAPRQSGKRNEILQLVAQFPDGATRAELIDKLDIKGNKAAEQSLSNALSALKRAGQLTLISGKYAAPAPA